MCVCGRVQKTRAERAGAHRRVGPLTTWDYPSLRLIVYGIALLCANETMAPELLAEASAIYEVVYEHAKHAAARFDEQQQQPPEYYVAFAWHVAGDFLLHTKKARLGRERLPERALFIDL